jgi:hypothetical protein
MSKGTHTGWEADSSIGTHILSSTHSQFPRRRFASIARGSSFMFATSTLLFSCSRPHPLVIGACYRLDTSSLSLIVAPDRAMRSKIARKRCPATLAPAAAIETRRGLNDEEPLSSAPNQSRLGICPAILPVSLSHLPARRCCSCCPVRPILALSFVA